jgi:hypothetical protein
MKNFHLAIIRKLGVLLAVVVLLLGVVFAKGPDKKDLGQNQSLRKTAGEPVMTILNINNITSFMRADGQGNHDVTDQAGCRYPRGTSTCLYEDGFVWGGKLYTDAAKTQPSSQLIRVGGQTYNQGTVEGAIFGSGAGATRMPPSDARARIYRIRRDYKQMTKAEILADAATLNLVLQSAVTQAQMDDIITRYDTDWTNWPVDLGAPYIERNGTPGYQAPPAFSETFTVENLISGNYDEPGVAGADPNSPADQVIWTVYNDDGAFGLYMSDPIGLEGQVTMWGYKRTDAMGNLYFKKIKLINKGGVDVGGGTLGSFYVDSMYISQWSDPDLGDSGDDLCGSDVALSLGFVYNGNPVDLEYRKFNLPPPAVGYDFLQGPVVPSEGDTAIFDLKKILGKRNLPMTAFVFFSAGSPISDPALTGQAGASYESTLRWYRMLRGLRPDASTIPERYYPFPPGTTPGPYALAGNPVTQIGNVDGLGLEWSLAPGDRRIILASGPFNLAPGDTQDIVVGTVAGIGSDRLSSVAVMKFNDTFVQNAFDALFVVPKSPAAPKVKYAELDGQVVLEWGSDLAGVAATEQTTSMPGTYTFEGYNVYQLPAAGSSLKDSKRIATYDLLTDPTVVLDLQADEASGQVLQKPVQFGTNSGIKRFFVFDKDYVKDIPRLNNGTEYFIVVTAYSVSRTGFLPISLESRPQVFRVIPQSPKPGSRWTTQSGETWSVGNGIDHHGTANANIMLKIIDPAQLTGSAYTIGFSTKPDKFAASYENYGEEWGGLDADSVDIWIPYSRYTLTGTLVLNQAATSITYSLRISNLDSLSGPITGAQFQLGPTENVATYPSTPEDINYIDVPSGAVEKTLTFTPEVVAGLRNGVATGSWSTTDATQPLTQAILDQIIAGNLYVNILTAANPAGEAAGVFGILTYPWYLDKGTTRILDYQQNLNYSATAVVPDNNYPIVDGFQFRIGKLTFKSPTAFDSWVDTKADGSSGDFLPYYNGDATAWAYADGYAWNFFGGGDSVSAFDLQQDIELRFTGVRADPTAEDGPIVSGGSIASVYSSNRASSVRLRIPFELWENDANGRTRQINCAIRDRNADGGSPWGSGGTPEYLRFVNGRVYAEVIATPYDGSTDPSAILPIMNNPWATWFITPEFRSSVGSHWDTGDIVHITIANPMIPGTDTYTFTTPAARVYNDSLAKADLGHVGVFPNPYYAFNPNEISRTSRFVTFNRLPQRATIRIFNLAGQLVRTLEKDDPSQFMNWDLANQNNFPVASGMYIVHVDMPDLGVAKVLKVAIIQEQEVPNNF